MCIPLLQYFIVPRSEISPLTTLDETEEYLKFMELQEKRKQQITSVCRKYKLENKTLKEVEYALISDVDDKFIFCNNYKVFIIMFITKFYVNVRCDTRNT